MSMTSSPKIKDRIFYGWIIVAAFFVVMACFIGIRTSFGVFLESIETEFALTRTMTSAINSTSWLLLSVSSVLGGWALDRYGPKLVLFLMGALTGLSVILTSQTNTLWQLFIAYGLLASLGSGAAYVITMSSISRWFNKKRAMAIGIAGSGAGLGTAAMAPLAAYLIHNYSWRTAYMVLGIMTLVLVTPLAFLMKRDPRVIGKLPDGEVLSTTPTVDTLSDHISSGLTFSQAVKTRSFWLMMFNWLLQSFCMLLLLTHAVPHATGLGFSAGEAASILSLIGITRAVGLIVMGIVADRIGRKKTAIICTLFLTSSILVLIWAKELWLLYLFAIIYGFGNGGLLSAITALMGDSFGVNKLGSILGILDIGWAVGSAIGPVVGGLFYDFNGSYTTAFILAAIFITMITPLVSLMKQEI